MFGNKSVALFAHGLLAVLTLAGTISVTTSSSIFKALRLRREHKPLFDIEHRDIKFGERGASHFRERDRHDEDSDRRAAGGIGYGEYKIMELTVIKKMHTGIANEDLIIMDDDPEVTKLDSDTLEEDVDVVAEDADFIEERVDIVNEDAELIEKVPDMIDEDPDSMYENPEIVIEGPDIIEDGPEVKIDADYFKMENDHDGHTYDILEKTTYTRRMPYALSHSMMYDYVDTDTSMPHFDLSYSIVYNDEVFDFFEDSSMSYEEYVKLSMSLSMPPIMPDSPAPSIRESPLPHVSPSATPSAPSTWLNATVSVQPSATPSTRTSDAPSLV